jgi:hypothetical protein
LLLSDWENGKIAAFLVVNVTKVDTVFLIVLPVRFEPIVVLSSTGSSSGPNSMVTGSPDDS